VRSIVVAVGSLRAPKLDAVREALALVGPMLAPDTRFEVTGADVPSGVGHTPVGRAEIMGGARSRAEALVRMAQERGPEPDKEWRYFVGLEGGIVVVGEGVVGEGPGRVAYLENWAYVSGANGRGSFGHSGGIALPERLAAEVLDRGAELSEAIENYAGRYAGGRGQGAPAIRDTQGAWGVLTRGLITRKDAFRVAVVGAFAPFYNAELYSAGARDAGNRSAGGSR
jgi:non-canonical (house-cleaning) NTP pyrophosphatase